MLAAIRIGVRERSPSHRAAITAVTTGESPKSTEISPEGMCWADQ